MVQLGRVAGTPPVIRFERDNLTDHCSAGVHVDLGGLVGSPRWGQVAVSLERFDSWLLAHQYT
jgi:hypothetical protein